MRACARVLQLWPVSGIVANSCGPGHTRRALAPGLAGDLRSGLWRGPESRAKRGASRPHE